MTVLGASLKSLIKNNGVLDVIGFEQLVPRLNAESDAAVKKWLITQAKLEISEFWKDLDDDVAIPAEMIPLHSRVLLLVQYVKEHKPDFLQEFCTIIYQKTHRHLKALNCFLGYAQTKESVNSQIELISKLSDPKLDTESLFTWTAHQGSVSPIVDLDASSYYLNYPSFLKKVWHEQVKESDPLKLSLGQVREFILEDATKKGFSSNFFDQYYKEYKKSSFVWGLYQNTPTKFKNETLRLLKMVENEPEYIKIAFVVQAFQSVFCLADKSFLEQITELKESVKGWYDLAKILPQELQWLLYQYKVKDKPIQALDFLMTPYLRFTSSGYNVPYKERLQTLGQYSPYDARGGFCVKTFEELCVGMGINPYFIDVPKKEIMHSHSFREMGHNILSFLMGLAYLYGADHEGAKRALSKYKSISDVDSDLEELTLKFPVVPVKASTIQKFRPILLKNPKLIQRMPFLDKVEFIDKEPISLLQNRIAASAYRQVPSKLVPHMHHALANGWEQEIVDQFVGLALTKAAKTSLIPEGTTQYEDITIRILDKKDPKALYIGELSACCQHINEGAGSEAAVQSYSQPWCGVLAIESTTSNFLLAQSFVWLDVDKKYLVLDSIESILKPEAKNIKKISNAILHWAVDYSTKHGLTIAISDASCGITEEVVTRLEAKKTKIRKKLKICVTPYDTRSNQDICAYDELDYSDAGWYYTLLALKTPNNTKHPHD